MHITSIIVPQHAIKLEEQLEQVREEKVKVVKRQRYEEAAKLRDDEKNLENELEKAQKEWESEVKKNREIVDEDHVSEVVAMMTGIPIKRSHRTRATNWPTWPTSSKPTSLVKTRLWRRS